MAASTTAAKGPRQSADERRAAIIEAAATEFSAAGLHGTSTHAIAKRAGISQPYIFQLFGSKHELFLAACSASFQRVREDFIAAAAADPDNPQEAMGAAYVELLSDREALLMMLHAFAASSDPLVRDAIRDEFGAIIRLVERLLGTEPAAVRAFIAQGMLLNVSAALDLPQLAAKQAWAARMFEGTGVDCG